jgi:hypothetical protein
MFGEGTAGELWLQCKTCARDVALKFKFQNDLSRPCLFYECQTDSRLTSFQGWHGDEERRLIMMVDHDGEKASNLAKAGRPARTRHCSQRVHGAISDNHSLHCLDWRPVLLACSSADASPAKGHQVQFVKAVLSVCG